MADENPGVLEGDAALAATRLTKTLPRPKSPFSGTTTDSLAKPKPVRCVTCGASDPLMEYDQRGWPRCSVNAPGGLASKALTVLKCPHCGGSGEIVALPAPQL